MKYQLETIPVTDAWASDAPCPMCALMDAAEKRHVEYYLGNSVMNPETRMIVNKTGFCSRHFPMMREAGHAHHLGLLGHTHLETFRKDLAGEIKTLSRGGSRAAAAFAARIRTMTDRCLICDSMDRDEKRYSYTAVVLHRQEGEFRKLFGESRGPCLPHAAVLAGMAAEALGKKDGAAFMKALASHLEETLEELESDILRFTRKFDAQNDGLEWGNARDAHARTVQMLSGAVVRLED